MVLSFCAADSLAEAPSCFHLALAISSCASLSLVALLLRADCLHGLVGSGEFLLIRLGHGGQSAILGTRHPRATADP